MKELIIMVFKIDVQGLTRQRAEEQLWHLMKEYSFDDEELKKDYIVKQIWLLTQGVTDVKVIYPITGLFDNKLIKEIEDVVSEYPDSALTEGLNKILSEIKIKEVI